jgi:outer membrane lipoprotein-sorting protein
VTEHLGEVLELLYDARNRWRTARGVLLHRHSLRLTTEGIRREQRRQRRSPGRGSVVQFALATTGDGEPPPDIHEVRTRFWWEPPNRLREESDAQTIVRDGELWWMYTPDIGAVSNAGLPDEERARFGAGGGDELRQFLDPSGLTGVLEFDRIEPAGDVFLVHARPRVDLDDFHVHMRLGVSTGADRFELVVDRARGVVLRRTAYLGDDEMSSAELAEIAFDENFPDGTFVFVPPPGEEVRSPETAHRTYTLEEAIAEAPFAVFVFPATPEGWGEPHVSYHPSRLRPPMEPMLALFYHRSGGTGSLILTESGAGEDKLSWPGFDPQLEEIERNGVVYTTCAPDDELGTPSAVGFTRDGTTIRLQSDALGLEELLELATALVARPATS